MKVKIGPYVDWFGPYQMAHLLQKVGVSEDRCYAIGEWLSDNVPVLGKICQWIYDKRGRTVKIHIDKYDVWSMDNTLAMIILPMLKMLKENKHGSPMVDNEDVPANLRCENNSSNETMQYDMFACEELDTLVWDSYHKKWEWVLDEIIWAFEQKVGDNWEEQYWIQKPELDLSDYSEDDAEEYEGTKCVPVRWKVEGVCDWEGRRRHQERIDNGLRLFGKYYEGLWD